MILFYDRDVVLEAVQWLKSLIGAYKTKRFVREAAQVRSGAFNGY